MAPPRITRTLLSWDDDPAVNVTAGALEIDATSILGFEETAEITEHPVETGTAVADHIRPLNGTISLEGVITNSPIILPATQMNGVTLAPAAVPLPGGGSVTAQKFSAPFDRVRACDEVLAGLIRAGARVTVTTGFRITESLGIARYKAEKNGETGDSVKITLELKRVRIATTARAPVPAVRRAQVTLERGAQPADNRSSAARIQDSAPMRAVLNALGGG